MISAILSFLGGSAFRMIWGEASHFFTQKQEHDNELARMTLQGQLDDQAHQHDQDRIRLQSDLGVKEIQVKGDYDLQLKDADLLESAITAAGRPIGVKWVDAWNAAIRPLAASVALALWVASICIRAYMLITAPEATITAQSNLQSIMTPFDLELMGSIFGFFFADRSLRHRGK